MNNSISRQAAIDAIDYWYGIDVSEALYSLPSVIIRCRDCRYYDEHECKHPRALIFSEDDDFCSYAKRRING